MFTVLRIGAALISGFIAGMVLAHEGLVPITYVGSLMAAAVIGAGCFVTKQLGPFSEDHAVTFAKIAIVTALLIGIAQSTSTLHQRAQSRMYSELKIETSTSEQVATWWQSALKDPSATGGMLDAVRLRAFEGMVYGKRETYRPSEKTRNERKGFWAWLCWLVQGVLLFLGAFIGCLAISSGAKGAKKQAANAAIEAHAKEVEASIRKTGGDLAARAASAMIRNSDELPEIAMEIHLRRLEEEAQGDPTAFLLACLWTPYDEWVIEALRKGADANARDQRGNPAYYLAACAGLVEGMDALISHGADAAQTNSRGDTALHGAAAEGQVAAVEKILSSKAIHIDAVNNNNETALFTSCRKGKVDIAKMLHAHGAGLDLTNNAGEHALHVAVRNGHAPVVNWLLAGGVDPDSPVEGKRDGEALRLAVRFCHDAIVHALLSAGANANGCMEGGMTPLIYAADAGALRIVQRLLGKGADKHATCNGLTAYDYAVRAERPSPNQQHVVKLLK